MRPLSLATVVSLAAPLLLGCGPMTIWSSMFPLEYDVVTTLQYESAGKRSTQEQVTHCKLVDQTDSIAANTAVYSFGEPPWLEEDDGSLLILGSLSPCKWFPHEELPEPGKRFPLMAGDERDKPPDAEGIPASESWRLDDPANPSRLEVWTTRTFFHGDAEPHITATIGVTEAPTTYGLDAAFPWLASADAAHEAVRAAHKDVPAYAEQPLDPRSFAGVGAELFLLQKGATCPAPDATAELPILLPPATECVYLRECREGQDLPCRVPLGGVRPLVREDAAAITFRLDEPRPGYRATLLRVDTLPATAPLEKGRWTPEVCFGDTCFPTEHTPRPYVYFPAKNVLVELDPRRLSVVRPDLVREQKPDGER